MKKSILIITLLACAIIVIVITILLQSKYTRGELVLSDIRGEVATYKHSDILIISRYVDSKKPSREVEVYDPKTQQIIYLPESQTLTGGFDVLSPSGNKIAYPVFFGDSDKLFVYDLTSNTAKDIIAQNEFYLKTQYRRSSIKWVDDNTILYQCNPQKQDWRDEPFYCVVDINSGEANLVDRPPEVFSGLMPVVRSSRLTAKYFDTKTREGKPCLRNIDGNLCAYEHKEFSSFDSTSSLYELYVEDDSGFQLVYKNPFGEIIEGIHWTRDNNLYILNYNGQLRYIELN